MSSRSIVALGLWILLMVLVGTMTVGMALAFYLAVTAFFAVLVGVLMLVTRHREDGEHRA
jgi:heme A synthase